VSCENKGLEKMSLAVPRYVSGVVLTLMLACPVIGHAQLFGDDQARKAIIELRERIENYRRQTDEQLRRVSQDFSKFNEESTAPTRRTLLDLSNQIELLRQDQAKMRGQMEQLARDVSELQRQQKDVMAALEDRLRQLEPLRVTVEGETFKAKPEEKQDFEQAMGLIRKGSFDAAVTSLTGFLKRYPDSGYGPAVWYWLGNAQYASDQFKEAFESYRRFLTIAPMHTRAPEARLAMANCQLELKDSKAARRTLEDLIKAHPQTEAAAAAKDRLAKMR
jgi:tol-pal system protein YbgF